MRLLIISMVLGVCFCMLRAARTTEFSVGFSLAIDYGYVQTYQTLRMKIP
jgi:hypothetical protein